MLISQGDWLKGRELIIGGIISPITVLLLSYPLYYKILPSKLIVRCGLMRWQIFLDSIVEVSPTRNSYSAPTWSLDRLRIDYQQRGKRNFVLISPSDKTEFMRQLAATEDGLKLKEDRLVRID
ncbi:MAG: PH domain-containing protein [Cyanobacteria bacterium P01_A01_bin.83]